MFFLSSSWVGGISGNSAHVAVVSCHHYVPLHTPCSAPGILDKPVVFTFVCTIANSKNTMVKLEGAALRLLMNSAAVKLERPMGSINSNRDWANLGNSLLEGLLAVKSNTSVIRHLCNRL